MPTVEVQVYVFAPKNREAFSNSDARCAYVCAIKPTGTAWGRDDNLLGVFKIITRELTIDEQNKLFLRELAFNADDLKGPLLVPNIVDQLSFKPEEE